LLAAMHVGGAAPTHIRLTLFEAEQTLAAVEKLRSAGALSGPEALERELRTMLPPLQ
jgi:hypothetical protein